MLKDRVRYTQLLNKYHQFKKKVKFLAFNNFRHCYMYII